MFCGRYIHFAVLTCHLDIVKVNWLSLLFSERHVGIYTLSLSMALEIDIMYTMILSVPGCLSLDDLCRSRKRNLSSKSIFRKIFE